MSDSSTDVRMQAGDTEIFSSSNSKNENLLLSADSNSEANVQENDNHLNEDTNSITESLSSEHSISSDVWKTIETSTEDEIASQLNDEMSTINENHNDMTIEENCHELNNVDSSTISLANNDQDISKKKENIDRCNNKLCDEIGTEVIQRSEEDSSTRSQIKQSTPYDKQLCQQTENEAAENSEKMFRSSNHCLEQPSCEEIKDGFSTVNVEDSNANNDGKLDEQNKRNDETEDITDPPDEQVGCKSSQPCSNLDREKICNTVQIIELDQISELADNERSDLVVDKVFQLMADVSKANKATVENKMDSNNQDEELTIDNANSDAVITVLDASNNQNDGNVKQQNIHKADSSNLIIHKGNISCNDTQLDNSKLGQSISAEGSAQCDKDTSKTVESGETCQNNTTDEQQTIPNDTPKDNCNSQTIVINDDADNSGSTQSTATQEVEASSSYETPLCNGIEASEPQIDNNECSINNSGELEDYEGDLMDMDPSLLCPEVSMDVDDSTPFVTETPTVDNIGPRRIKQSIRTSTEMYQHYQQWIKNMDLSSLPTDHSILDLVNMPFIDDKSGCEISFNLTLEEFAYKIYMYGDGTNTDAEKLRIEYTRLHCTACNTHLGSALAAQAYRFVHPLLKVLVCKKCLNFYESGDFTKDEDGSELYCRWCGQGGKVICCSNCAFVFCQKCIRNNFGRQRLNEINESSTWLCFHCDNKQLSPLRVATVEFFDYIKRATLQIQRTNEKDRFIEINTDFSLCCGAAKSLNGTVTSAAAKSNASKTVFSKSAESKPTKRHRAGNRNAAKQFFNMPSTGVDQLTSFLSPAASSNSDASTPNTNATALRSSTSATSSSSLQFPTISVRPMSKLRDPTINKLLSPSGSADTNATNLSSRSITNLNSVRTVLVEPSAPPLAVISNDWFDKATRSSIEASNLLAMNLNRLRQLKTGAESIEQLATIHNQMQEVLSSTINTMIQIRKNLRVEFINAVTMPTLLSQPPPLVNSKNVQHLVPTVPVTLARVATNQIRPSAQTTTSTTCKATLTPFTSANSVPMPIATPNSATKNVPTSPITNKQQTSPAPKAMVIMSSDGKRIILQPQPLMTAMTGRNSSTQQSSSLNSKKQAFYTAPTTNHTNTSTNNTLVTTQTGITAYQASNARKRKTVDDEVILLSEDEDENESANAKRRKTNNGALSVVPSTASKQGEANSRSTIGSGNVPNDNNSNIVTIELDDDDESQNLRVNCEITQSTESRSKNTTVNVDDDDREMPILAVEPEIAPALEKDDDILIDEMDPLALTNDVTVDSTSSSPNKASTTVSETSEEEHYNDATRWVMDNFRYNILNEPTPQVRRMMAVKVHIRRNGALEVLLAPTPTIEID